MSKARPTVLPVGMTGDGGPADRIISTWRGMTSPIRDLSTKWSGGQKAQEEMTGPSNDFVATAHSYRTQLARRRRERRLIFRPGDSPFLRYWDAVGITVLAYTALYTPFEVAFMPSLEGLSAWKEPRFLIARFIDVYFTLDLCLQFCIGYQQPVDKDGASFTWVRVRVKAMGWG